MPAAATLRARSGADRAPTTTPPTHAPSLRLAEPPSPTLTVSPPHPHTPTPTPAPHPDTAAVLLDYLNPDLTLVKVAVKHKLRFEQITELIESPKAQAMLARLQQAEQRRAEMIVAHSQPAAVQALVRALSAKSPETARRAASALLRMNARATDPSSGRCPRPPRPATAPRAAASHIPHPTSDIPHPASHIPPAPSHPHTSTPPSPPPPRDTLQPCHASPPSST